MVTMSTTPVEPYRILFPVGALFAIVGVALWPALALGLGVWPGELHARLMAQGFELAFIGGFLLTFLPRVTRTLEIVRPRDTWIVLACTLLFGAAAWMNVAVVAQAAFVVALLTLTLVFIDRLRRRKNDPPEELFFIPLGIALGLVGGLVQLAAALGWIVEPAPRFGLRLVSLGMVLAIVLGVGAILVPTFIGIKDPLVIPKIAGAHERAGRRFFYAVLAQLFVATFVLEALGLAQAGALLRALVGGIMLLWVWKLWRLPSRAGTTGWLLWTAGVCVGLGLVATALWPAHAGGLQHLTLLGGYGFLTAGIATRVIVTHGGHGVDAERLVLDPVTLMLLALALVMRLGAEFAGPAMNGWLMSSGATWCLAWIAWLVRVLPRVRHG
jgi:uncharacterized protein involved in response to NO